MIDKAGWSRWFSDMDLLAMFNQIRVHEAHVERTAFKTNDGTYRERETTWGALPCRPARGRIGDGRPNCPGCAPTAEGPAGTAAGRHGTVMRSTSTHNFLPFFLTIRLPIDPDLSAFCNRRPCPNIQTQPYVCARHDQLCEHVPAFYGGF